MVNPAIISVPKLVWTKIATAVTLGQVWNKNPSILLSHTYRMSPGVLPTNLDDAVNFPTTNVIGISSALPIDVYVYNHDRNDDGEVRVDL